MITLLAMLTEGTAAIEAMVKLYQTCVVEKRDPTVEELKGISDASVAAKKRLADAIASLV